MANLLRLVACLFVLLSFNAKALVINGCTIEANTSCIGADLSGADLSNAYLSGANLTGADLSDANLSGAYLDGADLTGADLSYISANSNMGAFTSINLSGANLTNANLFYAYFPNSNLETGVMKLGSDESFYNQIEVEGDCCFS